MNAVTRPARLLDPGMCLTLRPMAYPTFFEMYRAAIKNTWTVEEVDFSTDVGDLQKQDDRRRAPPDSPAGRLLRDRRLDRREQPRPQPLQAHQRARGAHVPVAAALRGGAARPVLPDAARHLRARSGGAHPRVRRGREHPLHPEEGGVLPALDGLDQRPGAAGDARPPPAVPAQPHLLRGLHRGAVLLRRVRLRLLPPLARACLHGLAAGTNWVFRDESAHMAFAFEVGADDPPRGAGAVRRRHAARGREDVRRGGGLRDAVRRGPARTRRRGPLRRSMCGATWSTAPISASPRSACPSFTATRNPLTFMDLQDVQEVANFFERRVSAYQMGVEGDVVLDAAF